MDDNMNKVLKIIKENIHPLPHAFNIKNFGPLSNFINRISPLFLK